MNFKDKMHKMELSILASFGLGVGMVWFLKKTKPNRLRFARILTEVMVWFLVFYKLHRAASKSIF